MSKYKMLATDLDDTLLDSDLNIHPLDREALGLAREQGIRLVLSTGRMYRATLPFAVELGIDTPLITYQGALVKSVATGEVLLHRPVPLALALKVLERVKPLGYHVNVYLEDCVYIEKNTPENIQYEKLSRVKSQEVGPLDLFLKRESRDPTKVLVVAAPEDIKKLEGKMKELFREQLHITISKPHFLEFSHPEATKGSALELVAGLYGISRQEIVAVGDSYNDLEMLQYAGLAAVVGNAPEAVKAVAQYVSRPNTQGGLSEIIHKFILSDAE